MTLLMAFFAIMFSFSKVDQEAFDKMRETISKQFGGEFQLPFEDISKALDDIIKKDAMTDKIKVKRDGSGISIVFTGTVFFEAGSVNLSEASKPILTKVLDVLEARAKGYPLYVEGHTDDTPISSQMFPSNWELSGARASLVVRMLEERKFSKDWLHSQGFADSRPVVPNRDNNGQSIAENQAQNRRVVIRVLRK